MGCSSSSHRNVASPIEQVIILSHCLAATLLRCGYVPLLQLNPCLSICFQAENKAIAQDDKSSIAGAPDHVRLVVNATSQSQVSSNSILGTEATPGMSCKFQKEQHLCCLEGSQFCSTSEDNSILSMPINSLYSAQLLLQQHSQIHNRIQVFTADLSGQSKQ